MKSIELLEGLKEVQKSKGKCILRSNGLTSNEYIMYRKGFGICYENGCLIGKSYLEAFNVLKNLKWVDNYKFYLVELSVKDRNNKYANLCKSRKI